MTTTSFLFQHYHYLSQQSSYGVCRNLSIDVRSQNLSIYIWSIYHIMRQENISKTKTFVNIKALFKFKNRKEIQLSKDTCWLCMPFTLIYTAMACTHISKCYFWTSLSLDQSRQNSSLVVCLISDIWDEIFDLVLWQILVRMKTNANGIRVTRFLFNLYSGDLHSHFWVLFLDFFKFGSIKTNQFLW